MYPDLIKYCARFIELDEEDEALIRKHFHPLSLKKKSVLLEEGRVCDFVVWINSGILRYYHIKDGNEITCGISLSGSFVTDYSSFTQSTPSDYTFQALSDTDLLVIDRKDLRDVYGQNRKFETFGRFMAENASRCATKMAIILVSNKPEERVRKLMELQPELFQLVPQRYLANMLGITPESFSRIRARR